MARDIARVNMENFWGRSVEDPGGGSELQRADLWTVDFTIPVNHLITVTGKHINPLMAQHAKSVTFPERKVNAQEIRRDSMPFMMPAWDAPLGEIKINFWFDSKDTAEGSVVMNFLELWQHVVRAGRGDRGTGYYGKVQSWLTLDENYRADYAYDFSISLVRGNTNSQSIRAVEPIAHLQAVEDFRVKQAWLSSYRVTDLSYASGTELVSVEATFYAEDIVRLGDESSVIGPLIPLTN